MNTRSIVLSALVASLLSAPVWAGEAGGPKGKPGKGGPQKMEKKHPMLGEEFIKKLDDRLTLTPEQRKKAQDILAKTRPDLEKVHAEMKELKKKMKAVMRSAKESLRETLDMDQREKFDEMMARMRRPDGPGRGMKGRGGPRPGGPRGEGAKKGGGEDEDGPGRGGDDDDGPDDGPEDGPEDDD